MSLCGLKRGFSNVILDIYNNVGNLAIFGWIAFFYLAVHVSFVNRKCAILYNDANRPIVVQTPDNGAPRQCFFSSNDGHTVPCEITGTSNRLFFRQSPFNELSQSELTN